MYITPYVFKFVSQPHQNSELVWVNRFVRYPALCAELVRFKDLSLIQTYPFISF